jgi:hypothetical protein
MLPKQKSPVTIEDLLRLKKAERPGAEFWSQFERELRQKQLTALVKKRRWWHDLPVLLSRRIYMPAGAAAAVAFTLVTVRYSVSSPVAQLENHAAKIAAADPAIEVLPVTEVSVAGQSHARQEAAAVPSRISHREAAPAMVANAQGDLTEVVGLLPVQAVRHESETPSARSIAANLAHLEQAEPELANAVMGSRLTPARVATSTELSTDDEVDASKKYRLIARYADHSLSPEPAAPALVRERIARRLGDDISDRISRVGLEGSRVSLKF